MSEQPKRKKMTWTMLAVAAAIGLVAFIVTVRQHEPHPWITAYAFGGWLLFVAAASYRCWQDSPQVPTDPPTHPSNSN